MSPLILIPKVPPNAANGRSLTFVPHSLVIAATCFSTSGHHFPVGPSADISISLQVAGASVHSRSPILTPNSTDS